MNVKIIVLIVLLALAGGGGLGYIAGGWHLAAINMISLLIGVIVGWAL